MKKYRGHWTNGITKTVTAQNKQEAKTKLDAWAISHRSHLPYPQSYYVTKIETKFDTILRYILIAVGFIGAWIIFCTAGADELQPLTVADFIKQILVGAAMTASAIAIYIFRYEREGN